MPKVQPRLRRVCAPSIRPGSGRRIDATRLVNFSALPSGLLGLAALVVGFIVSLPFQQSAFGEQLRTSTGLPINALSDDVLHYADFAYLIGFAVAALVYWIGWRMSGRAADEPMLGDRG